jgi:hypothetical protein
MTKKMGAEAATLIFIPLHSARNANDRNGWKAVTKLVRLFRMELPETVLNAAIGMALLIVLDWNMLWWVLLGFGMDYEENAPLTYRRAFPRRKPFLIAKMLIGLCFIVTFVSAITLVASDHMGLAISSLALVIAFAATSAWESVKAFRHYAANFLTPRPRGGYRGS